MKSFALLLLLNLSLAVAVTRAAAEKTFHVAPSPRGNDAHEGGATAPFATLDRARMAVRSYLAAHEVRGDIVVEIHGGTYELAAPMRFDAADSGENGGFVIYRAVPGENVLLSGGRRVTAWTRESEGVYRSEVGRDVDFRQLWIGDQRAVRARTPNVGAMFHLATEKQVDGFDLPREQLHDIALRPDEIEISVLIAWMHKRLRISRLDVSSAAGSMRAVINPLEWDAVTKQPQGDRVYAGRGYWLENACEFLDAAGEFFLDRRDGVLRYRPRPGEDMARIHAVRPALENLIVLEGRTDAPVHHLRFEGLTFLHTGWTRPNRAGFVDVQANSLVPSDLAAAVDPQYRHDQRKDRIPAAFQAMTADHVIVRACRFARLGGAGIVFTQGGDDNTIEGNSFYDLAAGGIELGDDAARPKNLRLFPRRNRIANNFLAHIGEDYFGSVAILGYYTDTSLITRNEIVNVPYTAISQGWGWGKPGAPADSRANRITHNRVSNFMRRLDDGGGIYTTDRQLGSEIAHNYIERMTPPDDHLKAGAALYPDQCTEGTHWRDNVVAEAPRWLHLWNPNIRGNRIEATYADTAAHRNDGPENVVEAVHVVADRNWPVPARAIIASAGIEREFVGAREFFGPTEFVVENTSVDFQALAGRWAIAANSTGWSGAPCLESTDENAAARWLPLVPQAGNYLVEIWRPAESAGARAVVRHADGESSVSIGAGAATESSGGRVGRWHPLGRFRFLAGAGAELTLMRDPRSPPTALRIDAIRLSRQR
jgi:hypothetical protein